MRIEGMGVSIDLKLACTSEVEQRQSVVMTFFASLSLSAASFPHVHRARVSTEHTPRDNAAEQLQALDQQFYLHLCTPWQPVSSAVLPISTLDTSKAVATISRRTSTLRLTLPLARAQLQRQQTRLRIMILTTQIAE